MFLVIVANALFAGTYTLGKLLLSFMQPIYLNAFRMTIAGILLLSYQYFFNRSKLYIYSKKGIYYLILIAFFNIFLSYVLEFWALQYISSIKVTFLYNIAPLITPFFSYLFFSERMTFKKWIGLLIGFIGFIPVLINGENLHELKLTGIISKYEIAVILGVIAYCYGWIFLRRLVRVFHYEPITINGWIMLIGGLMSFIAAFFLETLEPIADMPLFLLYFVLLVVIGNLISNTLYTTLFKYYTVTFISFTGLTIPLFAAVYGYFFLEEVITMQLLISTIIVACGLYIFYQEELRQGYIVH